MKSKTIILTLWLFSISTSFANDYSIDTPQPFLKLSMEASTPNWLIQKNNTEDCDDNIDPNQGQAHTLKEAINKMERGYVNLKLIGKQPK